MNRHDRMIGLLLALQSGRKSAAQLAERFEVSRRTILRDIDGLSQVGVPVVAIPGAGGGYEVAPEFWLAPLQLTADEASLLLLGLKSLGDAHDSPFGLARATVEEKLHAILPEHILASARRELESIEIPTPHRPERLGHLAELREALTGNRWLRLTYRSVRRVAEHELKPVNLYLADSRWHCEALVLPAGELRNYRVDRITAIERIPDPISPPPVRARGVVERVEVAVRLTFAGARALEDHPDFASAVILDAGGAWLRFPSPRSELDYFARELFALGPEAIVREPALLRGKIRELALATLRTLEDDGDGDGTVSPLPR